LKSKARHLATGDEINRISGCFVMVRLKLATTLAMFVLIGSGSAGAWSAISGDEIYGTTEVCSGHSSEFNASTCALAHCQGRCKVLATVRNGCASVVVDRNTRWYVAFSDIVDDATDDAMGKCTDGGGEGCRTDRKVCD
jgi:hypothetical protein